MNSSKLLQNSNPPASDLSAKIMEMRHNTHNPYSEHITSQYNPIFICVLLEIELVAIHVIGLVLTHNLMNSI